MSTDQISDRAGGMLLALGVADGWSSATELALCVGDAAATGLALTDASALGLLERNLRELRLEPNGSAGRTSSSDEILAAAAVVALAHLGDTADERADATRAVLAVVDAQTVVGDEVLRWVELVAATVLSGALPDGPPGASASATAEGIGVAVNALGVAERTVGAESARFAAGLAAGAAAPAATGALLGARFGWRAVPRELAEQAQGWPGAGSKELVGLGILAAREHARTVSDRAERSGGRLPIERWDESTESAPVTNIPALEVDEASSSSIWRRSQVVLTTADADTATEQANDGRAGA